MVPTNPPVSLTEVTGAEIRQMIEENLERTFAADPYDQMGGYIKRMRGVDLAFKAENPKGQRIERLFLAGRPANDGTVYAVSFITEPGVPARFGKNRSKDRKSDV